MKMPTFKTPFSKIIASMVVILCLLTIVVIFLIIEKGVEEYSPSQLPTLVEGSPSSVVQNYIVYFKTGNVSDLQSAHELLSDVHQKSCPFDDFRYINNHRDSERNFSLSYPQDKQYNSMDPNKAYVTVAIEYVEINSGIFLFNTRNRYISTHEIELVKENGNWKINALPDNLGLPRYISNGSNCRS